MIRSTADAISTVPTPGELKGDFSAPGLPVIYDQSQPGDPQFQCNGVLNVICPNRLDQTALKLLAVSYPALKGPNAAGIVNNFISTYGIGGINNQYNAQNQPTVSPIKTLYSAGIRIGRRNNPTTLGNAYAGSRSDWRDHPRGDLRLHSRF